MVAAPFLGLEFKEPADVLRGARQMAAVEIAADPAVRAAFREKFMPPVSSEAAVRPGGAIVSTKPTPRGMDVIDEYHQYGPVKWLYRKPAKDFEDGLWLLVLKAKEEGLIEVTVRLPEEETDQLRTLLSVRPPFSYFALSLVILFVTAANSRMCSCFSPSYRCGSFPFLLSTFLFLVFGSKSTHTYVPRLPTAACR